MKIQRLSRAARSSKLWLVFFVMAVVPIASAEPHPVGPDVEMEKRVQEFVAAFNARDIDAMLELADENVQWLSVDGAKISVKAALRESMGRYFRSGPSCKSSLEWAQSDPSNDVGRVVVYIIRRS